LKLLAHDGDFDEFFVRTKRFRHDDALSLYKTRRISPKRLGHVLHPQD
jgi:hypothetical protein